MCRDWKGLSESDEIEVWYILDVEETATLAVSCF